MITTFCESYCLHIQDRGVFVFPEVGDNDLQIYRTTVIAVRGWFPMAISNTSANLQSLQNCAIQSLQYANTKFLFILCPQFTPWESVYRNNRLNKYLDSGQSISRIMMTYCCSICWSSIQGLTDSMGISTAVSGASSW
jgi:hypothetical protein